MSRFMHADREQKDDDLENDDYSVKVHCGKSMVAGYSNDAP
jgi:hypothetical protein